jgi:predicted ATP-grasp superfamily ATP-dependent carboligase
MSSARIGALVIGGDYRGLGAVRSLGRRGIPVWVLHDADHPLAAASRYANRRRSWPLRGDEKRLALLRRLAQGEGLRGWVLIPSSDEVVAFIARHHHELAGMYRLTTPPRDQLAWAHDKRSLHDLADAVGVSHPWTVYPTSRDDVSAVVRDFPLIIKPLAHEAPNPLARDKAWRVDDRRALLNRYDEAVSFLAADQVMLQELIPGGGEVQYSFAALAREGRALASVVARRVRQFPMDFGRLSTYVESVDEPMVAEEACRLLAATRHTGLIEIEFKLDRRDGRFKVLDANPRIWGWHTLSRRTGPDFVHLLYQMAVGEHVVGQEAPPGRRWVRLDLDLAVAATEVMAGRMRPRDYLASLAGEVESAIFAVDDPLPGVVALGQLQLAALRGAAGRLRAAIRGAPPASGIADQGMELLEVHEVMNADEEEPLSAGQEADQRVV